jgi:hypothetical protein
MYKTIYWVLGASSINQNKLYYLSFSLIDSSIEQSIERWVRAAYSTKTFNYLYFRKLDSSI